MTELCSRSKNFARSAAIAFCVLPFLLFLTACGNAPGESDASGSNYPNRDIEFIVPYSAGGGYDTWARLVAPYLEKHLPNDVSVIVSNEPGAGGLLGANKLYKAKPDGYEIQIQNLSGLAAASLMEEQEFDLSEFTYIAQIARDNNVLYVAADSEVDTIEDLKAAAPVKQGISGLTQSNGVNTVVIYDTFDIPFTAVLHDGSSEIKLSMLRGDVDASIGGVESVLEELKSGEMKPILVTSTEKPEEGEVGYEEVKDVPTIADAGHPEFEDNLDAMFTVAAPPGLPDDVKQVLDQAFQDALNDPELVAEAQESGRTPTPLNAADTESTVMETLELLGRYREALIEANQRLN